MMRLFKFRVNDLHESTGKQIEFNIAVNNALFHFTQSEVNVTFVYKSLNKNDVFDNKKLNVYMKLSPARGDYKIYGNPDGTPSLKDFLLQDLRLNVGDNINDYFAIEDLGSSVYNFYYIPAATLASNFFSLLKDKNVTIDESSDYDVQEDVDFKSENVILYGVPGSGKSWKVKNDYCSDSSRIERVVFHPDYTYADFVGQIMPTLAIDNESKVGYAFSPGPFTRVLQKAIRNPKNEYFLIIEEINRGNAPAIFGDIFQLLDRTETGRSVYGITNPDIAKYIYRTDSCPDLEFVVERNKKEIKNNLVYLPANLSIIATMNTADQNVFTLDTAFQRRWDMERIENDFDAPDNQIILKKAVGTTGVTWRRFLEVINQHIIKKNSNMSSCEDKRLGIYFVRPQELNDSQKWGDKVLKYLWDDVFKFNREEVFAKSDDDTLDKIVSSFVHASPGRHFDIFVNDIKEELLEETEKGK